MIRSARLSERCGTIWSVPAQIPTSDLSAAVCRRTELGHADIPVTPGDQRPGRSGLRLPLTNPVGSWLPVIGTSVSQYRILEHLGPLRHSKSMRSRISRPRLSITSSFVSLAR